MDIDNNYKTIEEELINTNRAGIPKFLEWLVTTDFKTAPASTKFHLHITGGLAEHSLNVLKFARAVNKEMKLEIKDDRLVIAGLLHDLCKINYYIEGEEWDKEYKDKTNQWRKKAVWKTQDDLPLGHGEKSAILASKFLDLKDEELVAIRWHMLKWDVSDVAKYTLQDAMNKFPLVKVIALGDQMAEFYETANNTEEI